MNAGHVLGAGLATVFAAGTAVLAAAELWRASVGCDEEAMPLPAFTFEQTISILSTAAETEAVFAGLLADSSLRVVGLDAEWKPHGRGRGTEADKTAEADKAKDHQRGRKNNINKKKKKRQKQNKAGLRKKNRLALLQVATATDVFLVHLFHFDAAEAPSLAAFLADTSVLKLGVGITGDGRKLAADHGLTLRGAVDLQLLAYRAHMTSGAIGLKRLTARALRHELPKSSAIQLSNWEVRPLSPDQVVYAAADAAVALAIGGAVYRCWRENVGSSSDGEADGPEPSCASDDDGTSEAPLALGRGFHAWASDYAGVRPRFGAGKNTGGTAYARQRSREGQIRKKLERRSGDESTRSTPLYENCMLQRPDGSLLAACSRRKADWYIDKGLGELLAEEPYTVRLTFEPQFAPHAGDEFYQVGVCALFVCVCACGGGEGVCVCVYAWGYGVICVPACVYLLWVVGGC